MGTTLRFNTTVLPGHRIEVTTPELPEGASVELLVNQLSEIGDVLQERDGASALPPSYPEDVNVEYSVLIETQWQRTLTQSEQERLEVVKVQIDAHDAASDTNRLWERQIDAIHQQLAAIRQEVEALPDAS